jgi:hypothetical protein
MPYENMSRGRSQVIWRYMPGSTFRYNESGGWCRTTEITLRDPKLLTGALASALKKVLEFWQAIGPTGFPDPERQSTRYQVGEPHQVWFTVWPYVFTCRQCGRVHWYKDLGKLLSVNDRLGCMSCRGQDQLVQVPYAYVHECGRLDSVFIEKGHIGHTIKLVNKGGFQESYWFCEQCRHPLRRNPRDGLGFRRCECAPKKAMRGVLLEDSRAYHSQTFALVDVEPKSLERWKENQRFSDLLLAGSLRIPSYRASHIQDLVTWKPTVGGLSPDLQVMKEILIKQGTSPVEAEVMVQQAARQAADDPWRTYDSEMQPYRTGACARNWGDVRRTVEYIFVRDEASSAAISLDQLIKEAVARNDVASVQQLTEHLEISQQLGIANMQIVQALPILLAGIGYSRYYPSPQGGDGDQAREVTLRPFASQSGKIPIYVARNTTEALLYEIDPWRLAAFLRLNLDLDVADPVGKSESAIRAWLMELCGPLIDRGESHLILMPFEERAELSVHEPSALIFGVLHTISHVLKATAHRYVGIDGDALSEYLFPAHQSGLLYVSNHVEFTLGGIDSVFRTNMTQWLGSARDYASRCSFDPVCSSSGGACLACLYPKFGCAHFNRTVSRAFLFGGYVAGHETPVTGFWTHAVATEASRLRQVSE